MHARARSEFFDWVSPLCDSERVFIPQWVASEYFNSFRGAIPKNYKPKIDAAIGQLSNSVERLVDDILFSVDGTDSAHNIHSILDKLKESVADLDKVKGIVKKADKDDDIHKRIVKCFSSAVVQSDLSAYVLKANAEWNARKICKLPPAFQDGGKDENPYGDLIIWYEILDFARSKGGSGVNFVFISNDVKKDWVYSPAKRKLYKEKDGGVKEIYEQNDKPKLKFIDPRLEMEFSQASAGSAIFFIEFDVLVKVMSAIDPSKFAGLAAAVQRDNVNQSEENDAALGKGVIPDGEGVNAAAADGNDKATCKLVVDDAEPRQALPEGSVVAAKLESSGFDLANEISEQVSGVNQNSVDGISASQESGSIVEQNNSLAGDALHAVDLGNLAGDIDLQDKGVASGTEEVDANHNIDGLAIDNQSSSALQTVVDDVAGARDSSDSSVLASGDIRGLKSPVGDDCVFNLSYSDLALSDSEYLWSHSDSDLEAIVSELKSYNWYVQNPAVLKIRHLSDRDFSDDAWFVLGRNVYQAACGNAQRAMSFLGNINYSLSYFPDRAACNILAGVIFEIYFNGKGIFRESPKFRHADAPLKLVLKDRYRPVVSFMGLKLASYEAKMAFVPGERKDYHIYVSLTDRTRVGNMVLLINSVKFNGVELLNSVAGVPLMDDGCFISISDIAHVINKQKFIPLWALRIDSNIKFDDSFFLECGSDCYLDLDLMNYARA